MHGARFWLVAAATAIAVAVAALTGGVTGWAAPLTAAPMAVAIIMAGEAGLAQGLALTLVAIGLAALTTASGAVRPHEQPTFFALALVGALGALAVGAARAARRGRGERRKLGEEARRAHELLEAALTAAAAETERAGALQAEAAEARETSQMKTRFLANMSHELRTPLNAIVGFSDIMRGQMFGPLSAKYAEYAELIHESGGHLLELINDVIDVAKIEADRYELAIERFDARETVAAALRLTRVQAEAAGVRLRGALGPEPIAVAADRRALKQIVLNLISNALKFTPAGGKVTVGLRAAEGALELFVGDTGVGVAAEDLARLGQPFEQAGGAEHKAMGSGLGLALVRALAERHGGSLSIESSLGEGTIVAVRLPVLVEHVLEPPFEPGLAEAALGANVIAFPPSR